MIKKTMKKDFKEVCRKLEKQYSKVNGDSLYNVIILKDIVIGTVTAWRDVGIETEDLQPLKDMYLNLVKLMVEVIEKK